MRVGQRRAGIAIYGGRNSDLIERAYALAHRAALGPLYDFGKDYLKGLRAGLGTKASQIIAEASYEIADPTIDSQIVQLKSTGVDTLIEQSSAKAAQSIRKVHELGWTPLHIIGGSAASVETVLKPAGLDASKGLVTTQFLKQPGDPAWPQ